MRISKLASRVKIAERFTRGRGGRNLAFIGIHTMEAPETSTRAEWCIDYFANNPDNRSSSTHYAVDNNSVAAGVSESDTAWTIGSFTMNQGTINIELAGYAGQSKSDWRDEYSRAQLRLLAKLCADIMKRNNIPIRVASDSDVREYVSNPRTFSDSRGGIITHGQVTRALRIRGGHTDPGPNFPMDYLLDLIKEYSGGGGGGGTSGGSGGGTSTKKPVPTAPKTLKRGSSGGRVALLQEGLNRVFPAYSKLKKDGHFGPLTEAVIKEFQRRTGLKVDGYVGPATTRELGKYGIKF